MVELVWINEFHNAGTLMIKNIETIVYLKKYISFIIKFTTTVTFSEIWNSHFSLYPCIF